MRGDPTILLVEDNPDDADLLGIAMAEAGITASLDVVGGGAEALAYVRRMGPYGDKAAPDLVLLDLNLPDVDGREVLYRIKSDPRLCSIPVIVMSTSVDDNDVVATYRNHANAFVSKPPDFEALVTALAAIQAFWLTAARLPTD
jgi:two-component system, chemotaxis family, response regulator Rcp1